MSAYSGPEPLSSLSRPRCWPVRFIEAVPQLCGRDVQAGREPPQVSTSSDLVLRTLRQDSATCSVGRRPIHRWDVVLVSTSIRALAVTLRLGRSNRSGGDCR